MIFDIQSRNDIITGAALTVSIPEEELDKKALFTIDEEKPEFILPFRYRAVDGMIEFTYRIGTRIKMQYLAGDRNAKEYAELWSAALEPLIECSDWFLKPYSFVLDAEYLYCDKNDNSISYVYIPSKSDCSDYRSLKEMAAGLARQVTIRDAELENKVLRSIMLDFNPKTFVKMIKACSSENEPSSCAPLPMQLEVIGQRTLPMLTAPAEQQGECGLTELNLLVPQSTVSCYSSDIVIDMSSRGKSKNKASKSLAEKSSGRSKRAKGAKNANKQETGEESLFQRLKPKRESSLKAALSQQFMAVSQVGAVAEQSIQSAPPLMQQNAMPDITQSISFELNGARLRLIGSVSLPPFIEVTISEGEMFTVGRYDSAAGKQQSCFEFDKSTKAVSRRHCAIERFADGYSIIDLSSSAGTFLDGKRLPPNTPCMLRPGYRVSFGNCGADYVWEQ